MDIRICIHNSKIWLAYWLHNFGSIHKLPFEGIDGSDALGYFERTNFNHGVGQYLDMRCLRGNLNGYFEIKGWFKLKEGSEFGECKVFFPNWEVDNCPSLTFERKDYIDPQTKYYSTDDSTTSVAATKIPYRKDQFNLMHGVFKVSEDLQEASRVFAFIQRFPKKWGLILDDFTIVPFDM